jgi:hypothetical protein
VTSPASLAELVQFAPEVYGLRHDNHVAVFIVDSEGVVLLDPIGEVNRQVPALTKAAIRTVTDKPVRYVVYSHSSADHSMGGAIFADTAQFVGHTLTATRMAEARDPELVPPTLTFNTRLSLSLRDRQIDLYAADLWEEDDYLILHDATARVAAFVDLVQPKNIAFRRLVGHPERIVERLQWLADSLEFDRIVSGHATPQMSGTKNDVREACQYYVDLSNAIQRAGGGSPADVSAELVAAVRADLIGNYGQWRRFDEMLALNIEGMLRWRAGEKLGHFLGAPD